jgi:EmrB/QacA subfamily drug resistance transporter
MESGTVLVARRKGFVLRKRRYALATLCIVLFLTFLDTTIVSVALADIQANLHAGVSSLQWVVNGYALVFASLMLTAGSLGDRFGRKRLLVGGLVVFAAGSVMGARASNTDWLIASRGLMGLGAAASEPGTLSIIRHLYEDRASRARALGVWAAVAGLALALGPVIGGVLVGVGGWRDVFWFNLAIAAAALVAAVLTLPESRDPQCGRLDYAGFVLAPVALSAAIFAIILGETDGYTSAHILTLFVVSGIAAVLFIVAELRADSPLLDPRFLRRPAFSGALIVAFATYFGIFAIFFFTALYLQEVVGYSAYRVAMLFIPMAVAMIFSSMLAGRWVARAGPRLPMTVGCMAAGAGILLTDLALRGTVHFAGLAAPMTLAGLGFGIAVVPITSVALAVIPPAHSGMAASSTTTAREMGSVLGVAVLGAVVNGQLNADLTRRLTELKIPTPFQQIVINAVETGQVPAGGSGGAAGPEAQFGPIVAKVIDATYQAFHWGLSVSLYVAGGVILASAVVGWFTLAHSAEDDALV